MGFWNTSIEITTPPGGRSCAAGPQLCRTKSWVPSLYWLCFFCLPTLFFFLKGLFLFYWFTFQAALGLRCHPRALCHGIEQRLPFVARCGPQQAGSVIVAQGLGLSVECGTFPEQGLNPVPSPALAGEFLTTGSLGSPYPLYSWLLVEIIFSCW